MRSANLLTLLFALLAVSAAADDQGLWTSVAAEKRFGTVTLELEGGLRTAGHARHADRWDAGAALSWKAAKWLEFGLGYTYIYKHSAADAAPHYNSRGTQNGYNVEHAYWRNRDRVHFDVAGKVSVGRFGIGLRERLQYYHFRPASVVEDKYRGVAGQGYTGRQYGGYAYSETETDPKALKEKYQLRHRLAVDYNIRHSSVDPFASYELTSNVVRHFRADKHRVTAGAVWKISKQHRLSAAYVWTSARSADDDGHTHALSLSYKFRF